METFIRKWGNSPAVRLPSALLSQAGYKLEQKIELAVVDERIVIQAVKEEAATYKLDALVDGITDSNVHDEATFGEPVGREEGSSE